MLCPKFSDVLCLFDGCIPRIPCCETDKVAREDSILISTSGRTTVGDLQILVFELPSSRSLPKSILRGLDVLQYAAN